MPVWLFYLLGPLGLISPFASCVGALAAVFLRPATPRAIVVLVYSLLSWGALGGVAYLVWSVRFWRLHAAGVRIDYIFDTAGMRVNTLIIGLTALFVSALGFALARRRRRSTVPA